MQEEDESSDVSVDLSNEDIEGAGGESESEDTKSSGDEESSADDDALSMTMEEMMDKILEGHVNEVDEYLATLDPEFAASTKKSLLERIDALMQSDDFKD